MQQERREDADSGKNEHRQRDPAVRPTAREDNLQRVGEEDCGVDRDERGKRELSERFQSARIIGGAIEFREIAGHAGEEKAE